MSENDKIIEIIMEDIKELKTHNKDQDKSITKLSLSVGKMQVRMALFASIFSFIGGSLGVILIKFLFDGI